jgi:hypothetical protein
VTPRRVCRSLLSFVALIIFSLSCVKGVYAQASLPGFSVPSDESSSPPIPMLKMNDQMFSNYETAFLKLRNKMLSDTLILQYQISLLKILIKRQGEVNNIANSFGDLGVNFRQPAPDKQICERLPENLLCVLFYPEVYDIDVEALRSPPALPLPIVEPASLPSDAPSTSTPKAVSPSLPSAPVSMSPDSKDGTMLEDEIYTPYLWTDIQCAASSCKAVLVDTENAGRRYTVRSGESLPDESVVLEISVRGIKVKKEDEILDVDPAPANGNFATARRGDFLDEEIDEQGMRDALSNVGIPLSQLPRTTNNNQASQELAEGTQGDQGGLFDSVPAPATTDNNFISDAAPAPINEPDVLGPTGLF